MKKIVCMMLCLSLMLGGFALAEGAYTPGTYEGVSENGRNGSVKVEVTFTADAIEDTVEDSMRCMKHS